MSATPAFDSQALATLRELDEGDPGFFRGVIDEYATQLSRARVDLQSALDRRDSPAFERIAHSLKGASATVGANAVLAIARSLEQIGAEARWNDAEQLLGDFAREAAKADHEIASMPR